MIGLARNAGAWSSTFAAVRRLEPVVMGHRGRLRFALATGGWLAQSVTEWGVAVLLLVFLHSLGMVRADAFPSWLPLWVAGHGVLAIWGALLVLAALQSVLQIASYQARAFFSQRIEARLRMILAYRALMQRGAPPALSQMNYLTGEVFPRTASFFFHVSQVACFAVQAVTLGAAMLYVDPMSALVALGGISAFGALVLWFNSLNNRASARLPEAQTTFERSKVRLSRNWLFIRALRLEREEYLTQVEASARCYRYNITSYFFANLGTALGPIFGVFLIATIVFVYSTIRSNPAAALLPFFYLLFRFQQLLANGSHLVGGLFTYRVHVLDAARFIAEIPESDLAQALRADPAFRAFRRTPSLRTFLREPDSHPAQTSVSSLPPALIVRDLSFQWAGEHQPLLSSLSVDLPAGRQLAIVGQNGTGKSTFLAILLGALSPAAGMVLLDGIESACWVTRHREAVGFVGSEPYLVAGTVRQNLMYGLGRLASDDALWQAVGQVGLAGRVRSLPNGLDYRIEENGEGLSAGERQKLAIARALLRHPRLLILDEPTAHVDAASEHDISEVLRRLSGRCTVVVISHKPGVLRYADRVLSLEGSTPPAGQLPLRREVAS